MAENKHTAGPWWAASGDDVPAATYRGIVAILSSDPPIYVVTGEHGDKNGPSCHSASWTANARLIAAAPDLLEALKQLLGNAEIARFHLTGTEDGMLVGSALFDTIQQARAAIARATQPGEV